MTEASDFINNANLFLLIVGGFYNDLVQGRGSTSYLVKQLYRTFTEFHLNTLIPQKIMIQHDFKPLKNPVKNPYY